MEIFIIGVMIFLGSVMVIELLIYAGSKLRTTQKAKIKKRLRKYTFEESTVGDGSILKKKVASDIPWLNRLLLGIPVFNRLDDLVLQANTQYSLGFYLLLSALLGAIGHLLGSVFIQQALLSFTMGVCLMFIPFLFLARSKRQRVKRFRAQFHEGLEFVARALKAGQAFTGGMRLAADEFADPLGTEFDETLDEINFGVSVPEALKHMAQRVDCPEIRYFVVAVIIQRETGGNLAELMEKLAHMIRQRYEFDGKLKTLTAEGKMSAVILIALPFIVLGLILVMNPAFLAPLFNEPLGRMMMAGGCVSMVFGTLMMSKMIKIEV